MTSMGRVRMRFPTDPHLCSNMVQGKPYGTTEKAAHPFTPVPLRTRRDGWTVEKQPAFGARRDRERAHA